MVGVDVITDGGMTAGDAELSNGGACVEVGLSPQLVAVRDSKDPDGPRLAFSAGAWDTFIGQIKHEQPGPA